MTTPLYPHMTVFDNMAYGLKIANMPKAEIKVRVDKAAGMLNLSDFIDRKPRALSGGQRQRVAMGRALVRDPATFLLDEPLSNLDAKRRLQMRLQIKEMQPTVGTTSLYVTHDQSEAMTLADRLIVMNAGVAEQIDTPKAIYDRPANVFVAGFIGSPAMNFVSGTLCGDGLRLASGQTMALTVSAAYQGRAVIAGLRPEHLKTVEASHAGAMSLRVRAVETLGADAHAHTVMQEDAAVELIVRVPGARRLTDGETLHVVPKSDSVHLFDAVSGRRN